MWSIWQQRSKRVWDNVRDTHTQVVTRGSELLLNWQLTQKPANEANIRSGADRKLQAAIRWKKPDLNCFKCNIDASFDVVHHRVGIGMCIKDDMGSYVLAKT